VRVAGACNAVKRLADGRLVGDMFDGAGFVRGVQRKGFDLSGKRVLVRALGSSSIRQTKFWEDIRQQLIESGFSLDQVCSSLQAHVFHCRMLYSWPPDGLL
jgi:hypothetical protein